MQKAISALPAPSNASGDLSVRLLAVLDRQRIGVWEYRADRSCVYLSSFALDAAGLVSPTGEISLDEFLALLDPARQKALRLALAQCILKGEQFAFELKLGSKDFWLEGTSFQDARGRSRVTAIILPEPEKTKDESESLRGMKILAVDDCEDSRSLVGAILCRSGAEVISADSAESALRLIETERPDLIISDLGMPGQDGFTLMEMVRALPLARGGDTPAIALSGWDEPEDVTRAIRAGFQRHLSKPVDPDLLLSCAATIAARSANAG